ncbi:large-conductance mechanosensitive channel [Microbulbifer hydrolyticus]|uniref:Large-conductance mechanosensitive channel n=1 Tax=Microbulbifer hydrolyticus TaxID=48074 RepID=A0AA89T322_9GAMM|nr:large-conductance mechanosensitive channel [Microbulbifer hydrolyticus]
MRVKGDIRYPRVTSDEQHSPLDHLTETIACPYSTFITALLQFVIFNFMGFSYFKNVSNF